ncbi:hypothetical protein D3C78_1097580 [compost metagenome]
MLQKGKRFRLVEIQFGIVSAESARCFDTQVDSWLAFGHTGVNTCSHLQKMYIYGSFIFFFGWLKLQRPGYYLSISSVKHKRLLLLTRKKADQLVLTVNGYFIQYEGWIAIGVLNDPYARCHRIFAVRGKPIQKLVGFNGNRIIALHDVIKSDSRNFF